MADTPENVEQEESQSTEPVDERTALKQQVEELEQDRNQFKALAQRLQADFENYQKRTQREREQERRYAASGFALDLLNAVDNLERAIEAAKSSDDGGSLVEGVSMVVSQILDTLRRQGVTRMEDLIGQPFNPDQHQALLSQPSGEHSPNTIVAVLKQGYMIHERVLRPADVAVAAPLPEPAEPE